MSNDKMREAEKAASDYYFSERAKGLDTIDRRSVYCAAFRDGANWQAALTQQPESEPLRFTGDGELAECPCCGSLDVGAVGGSCSIQKGVSYVNCYGCGLELKRKGTMKDACAAWNMRTGKRPQPSAQVPDNWLPTPENINALPDPVRQYIHDLVANADPAGMVRENLLVRDENQMLRALVDEQQRAAQVPEGWRVEDEPEHSMMTVYAPDGKAAILRDFNGSVGGMFLRFVRALAPSIAEKRELTTLSELRDTLHPEIVSRADEEYVRQAAAGKRESLGFRAGRQRLFDLIESMAGFTCLEDDMSEIEQVVLSYASESKS